MSSILIQDVSKTFETKDGSVQALKHVSLSIETGDIYGIIGMSGAGKSTLVRCMNFLEVPSEGKVLIDGKSLSEFSPKELRKEREKIGMIFQHFNLLMQKNVLENVCFPLYIQGKKKAEARAKALELLEIVGLADRAKAYPAQLSGGQKQRVAIARALASDRFPNEYLGDTNLRLAVDVSQMVGIRFGETIKAYVQKFGDASRLTAIPLGIAGWLRYMLGVDDEGDKFELAPDPMNEELQEQFKDIAAGKPETFTDQLKPILSNERLFFTDLYKDGVGEKIEGMFREMLAGPGAVRATIHKYVG